MAEYSPERWNTNWEIKFLEGLGEYRIVNIRKDRPNRKELLIKYYNLIDKRSKWGYIDREIIRETCQRMITHETIKENVLKGERK